MFRFVVPSAFALVCGIALAEQPAQIFSAQAAERMAAKKQVKGTVVRVKPQKKAARPAAKRMQRRRGERRSTNGNGWTITQPKGKTARIWGD